MWSNLLVYIIAISYSVNGECTSKGTGLSGLFGARNNNKEYEATCNKYTKAVHCEDDPKCKWKDQDAAAKPSNKVN